MKLNQWSRIKTTRNKHNPKSNETSATFHYHPNITSPTKTTTLKKEKNKSVKKAVSDYKI